MGADITSVDARRVLSSLALAVCSVYGGLWLVLVLPAGGVLGWSPRLVAAAACVVCCLGLGALAWRLPLVGGALLAGLGITVSELVAAWGGDAYPLGIVIAAPLFLASTIFVAARYEGEALGTTPWPWLDLATTWWWGSGDS